MNKLFLAISIFVISCGPSKRSEAGENLNGQMSRTDSAAAAMGIPTCIQKKIDSFKVMAQHEQPQRVVEYEYKGKTVYYVSSHCCDFFNELYDSNCNLMGYPDGGFTGRGDGKFPDFAKEVKKEKVIWEHSKE